MIASSPNKNVATPAVSEIQRKRHTFAPTVVKLLLLLCSTLVSLVLVEAGLRFIGMPPAQPAYGDPVLGFTAGRNITSTFDFPEYGGMLTMHVNNWGFCEDSDTPIEKAPGIYRMVFVGDSQTAGECANYESYPHVLQRVLNASRAYPEVECLNAGAGRYSPYQYLVKTRTQLMQFNPDHLVVGIYMGNDMMDLARRDDRPYLVKTPGGNLVHHKPDFILLDDPSEPPSMLQSIRLYGLFRKSVGATMRYQWTRANILIHDAASTGHGPLDVVHYMIDVKRLSDISVGFMTQSLLQYVWFKRFPESLPVAFEMNKYVMEQFKEISQAKGIPLTYVLIPSKLVIEPQDFQDVLGKVQRYDSRLTVKELQSFENQMTDVVAQQCRDLHIDVIDLRQPMMALKPAGRMYNPFEMHLTPAGNRLVGLILFDELRNQLATRRPTN